MKRSTWVVLLITPLVLSACGASNSAAPTDGGTSTTVASSTAGTPSSVSSVSGYRARQTVASLKAFPNDAVFVGRVVEVLPPRNAVSGDGMTLAWVPIKIDVIRTVKGAPSTQVILRALPGELGPDLGRLAPGTKVVAFVSEAVTLSDGMEARTPNGLLVVGSGGALKSAIPLDDATITGTESDATS